MNPQLQQLLDQLRDAHSPPGVNWWPLASGWWVLGILLVIGIIALAVFLHRRRRLVSYKKEALKLLEKAHQSVQTPEDKTEFLGNCSQILRRLLLYRMGREKVAQLTGNQWRELLEQLPGPKLSKSSLDALVIQQYRREPEFDSESLYKNLRDYISNLEPATRV